MSDPINQTRKARNLPAKDPPSAQDYLIATDYITGQLIRIPISALDIGDGGGDYSAGYGLTLSGTTFAVDHTVVTDRDQTVQGWKTFTNPITVQTSGSANNPAISRKTGLGISFAVTSSNNESILVHVLGVEHARFIRQGLTRQSGLQLSAAASQVFISNGSGELGLSGGSGGNAGANIVMYGETRPGTNTRGFLRAGTSTRAQWDAAGFTFSAPSDARIKAGIKPMRGLEMVRKLNPVSFRFNHAYRSRAAVQLDDRERYGFIAQEFAEVFPDAVEESGDEFRGEKILQLSSQDALPAAVAAIKELDAEVQALKAELARLKGEPS